MSLEQIGLKLKAARESQGLSLRQIHDRTKIPIGHLQSIDAGSSDDLPEPVYVAGFLKRYGDCVGLNGQSLSEEYRSEAQAGTEHNGKGTWGKNAGVPEALIVTPEYYRTGKVDSGTPTFKTIYFNAIWIVVVVGLVSYLGMTQLNNQANQQDPSVLSLQQSSALHNTNTGLPSSNLTGAPVVASSNDHVTLTATQHVWVEVKSSSSGQNLYTGYMESGDTKEFRDPQGLRIRAGNGASLNVDYQGKVEPFGEPAKVAERVFDTKPSAETATTTTATTTPSTTSTTTTTTTARPVSTTPRRVRPAPTRITAARDTTYRRIDDAPSRNYIPGEGLGGGTRSIDVPYRYTEGRLDAD
jgi:cytoskeleton protein RodZ